MTVTTQFPKTFHSITLIIFIHSKQIIVKDYWSDKGMCKYCSHKQTARCLCMTTILYDLINNICVTNVITADYWVRATRHTW